MGCHEPIAFLYIRTHIFSSRHIHLSPAYILLLLISEILKKKVSYHTFLNLIGHRFRHEINVNMNEPLRKKRKKNAKKPKNHQATNSRIFLKIWTTKTFQKLLTFDLLSFFILFLGRITDEHAIKFSLVQRVQWGQK